MTRALLSGVPLRVVHDRRYASAIGFALGGSSSGDGGGDDPALVRVRAAPEGRSGRPPTPDSYGLVVLGANGAAADAGATAFAFREAARPGARLRVHDGIADGTAGARLRPYEERCPEVDVELVTAPDDTAGRLVAASRAADLLVIGRIASARPPGT
ncbi:hypothetical protein [Streptomyces sp. NPDC059533]|uniref:hypothetical protein n=1 Tax=unclassified Streptomyces TaxID=2593676 RepID=UPI0036CB2635